MLFWDYPRLKYILPLAASSGVGRTPNQKMSRKFPWLFFGSVIALVAAVIVINIFVYDVRPGNSQEECMNACADNARPEACARFCDCIYKDGKPSDQCLQEYGKGKK